MTSRHKHYTFRRGEEVLEHSVRYLSEIGACLDELLEGDQSERVKLLLTSVAVEQRNLLGSVERLLEDAPDKVLRTYTQFTVEMPEEIEGPEEPLTTLGLVQWLTGFNGHLQEMFEAMAENHDAEEATEAFAALAQQVEAHNRRLSKEYQRTEDL